MLRFVVRRVATSILLLVATSALVFFVLRLLPGDPVITSLGASPGVSPADDRPAPSRGRPRPADHHAVPELALGGAARRSRQVVLQPVPRLVADQDEAPADVRADVPRRAAVGHLRRSRARSGRPVIRAASSTPGLDALLDRVPVAARVHRGHLPDLLPLGPGRPAPARGYVPFVDDPLDNLKHFVLPALTLALAGAPLLYRFLRASLLEQMNEAYVRTARGKGLTERPVVLRHAFRNSLGPSLTMLGLIVGYTLGGAVIIEYVFGIPGLGSLAIESVLNRDYNILQSVVILVSAAFILTSLVVDILYAALDPRHRLVAGSSDVSETVVSAGQAERRSSRLRRSPRNAGCRDRRIACWPSIVLAVIAAPLLTSYGPYTIDPLTPSRRRARPLVRNRRARPGSLLAHPLRRARLARRGGRGDGAQHGDRHRLGIRRCARSAPPRRGADADSPTWRWRSLRSSSAWSSSPRSGRASGT